MTLLRKDSRIKLIRDQKTVGNILFPVFLKLNELHTVLIGAGNVGLEKLSSIYRNSPVERVTVIALAILPEVYALETEHTGLTIIEKPFSDDDLDNADVVIAATNDSKLNNF